MSLVRKIIIEADNELRYLTIGELQVIRSYLKTGEDRIRLSLLLKNQELQIIQKASKAIFRIYPEYIAPGGNAEGSRRRSLCLRDYGWYLRLVTYGVLAGDESVIEKIGLIGVKEMYNSLGVPILGMIDAIQCLKEATLDLLSFEDCKIIAPYFDFIIQGMS